MGLFQHDEMWVTLRIEGKWRLKGESSKGKGKFDCDKPCFTAYSGELQVFNRDKPCFTAYSK
jgi:hypothetical protein